ncbi:hypothetical protein EZV73_06695 [Acidaminobacter sp. JC074]|uniref:ABC transporter permease n=1 Tax=Acidaminobacter sp. JC074 TaxID=2530199 RepID=UPI001F1065C3|nr:ABC-2 family transporter protein [Acidaminobacter sp. JC074]MCH4887251.1 hypothetical protein [Acidaminobacter sp. JC074]
MKLLFKYIKIHFMSQLEYKTSFILLTLGQFFVPFLIFVSMILLFNRFENLQGWTLYEVALIYSIIHMSFSISELIARGFDMFRHMVREGTFDRVLIRPRSTIIQVIGSKIEFTRVGRLIQSIIVMTLSIVHLDMTWSVEKIGLLILMVISGIFVFSGIFILGATLCFWTIEGLEVVNLFADGGKEMAQYPLGIYQKWIKNFFTFVIPFGVINYYPMLYLFEKTDQVFYAITPVFGILFIIPCVLIWNFGVGHYKSIGS